MIGTLLSIRGTLNCSTLILDCIDKLDIQTTSERELSKLLIRVASFLMRLNSSYKKNVDIAKVSYWLRSLKKLLRIFMQCRKELWQKDKTIIFMRFAPTVGKKFLLQNLKS